MGGLFNILGTGLKYLFAAVGLAVWLGGTGLAVYSALNAASFSDFKSLAAIGVFISIAGILIALVGSVILLRLTKQIVPFLLCIAFGVAAWIGGSGVAPDFKMGEAGPSASMPAPSAPSATAPEAGVGDSTAGPPASELASPGPSRDETEKGLSARSNEIGSSESDTPAPVIAKAVKPPEASQFQLAELRFNKPNEMRLQHAYTVSATIGAPGADLPQGLGDVGPTVTRQTEITRKVRVELISPDFKIEKLHAVDTVLITPKTPGQWSWKVTPLNEGAGRKLLLQVYGVIEEGGVAQGEALIKTYEETIPVTVTPIDRAQQVVNTVISSWQTIAGIFGVIGGIWVFLGNIGKALRGRKEPVTA